MSPDGINWHPTTARTPSSSNWVFVNETTPSWQASTHNSTSPPHHFLCTNPHAHIDQTLALDVDNILCLTTPPYYDLSKAPNIGRHIISFTAAVTAVIAGLRFRSSCVSSRTHGSSHEVQLNLDISSNNIGDLEFDPEYVKSVVGLVESRDIEKLKQLRGLEGLAQDLYTDLVKGLPNGHDSSLASRKQVFGEKRYPRKAGKALWGFLWEACHDTTLNILMLCAALSLGFGIKVDGIKEGWYDGVSIAVAVVLVIVVTGVSDYRQSRQFQHLSEERDNIQVQVVRGGRRLTVPILDVVVGDIVELKIGDHIPADGLLVQGRSLAIDESSFTGESDCYIPDPEEQPFLRSGSKIQDGYGSMLVTGVGTNTEWGHMMALLTDHSDAEQSPLQARLTETASLVGKVGLFVALVVLIILIIFYFTGHSSTTDDPTFHAGHTSATNVMDVVVHIFSIAVTIVVVAVPEGLPLAVTLTLAYSMRKMMLDNALVRRLAACETMGSATTICSDKTGTLTVNQMTVLRSWVAGKVLLSEEDDYMNLLPSHLQGLLFQGIAQNSMGSVFVPDSSNQHGSEKGKLMQVEVVGSPTEKALLWWGLKAGMNFQAARMESHILQVDTFNSAKKCAGVSVETYDKRILVHWKGAAEIILSMCNKWMDMEDNYAHERLMSAEKKRDLESMIEAMASSSLRCIALAFTTVSQESNFDGKGHGWSLPEADLTLLAVVGMKDPCRPGVKAAVEAVNAAGVKVRMVTGDNLATAKAIALECGILGMVTDQLAVEGLSFGAGQKASGNRSCLE